MDILLPSYGLFRLTAFLSSREGLEFSVVMIVEMCHGFSFGVEQIRCQPQCKVLNQADRNLYDAGEDAERLHCKDR